MARQAETYESLARECGAQGLKRIRKQTGFTQDGFARHIGISESGYGNYERGDRTLPQGARLAVLDRFGSDPLPTDVLPAAFGNRADAARPMPLRLMLRQELCRFRETNYSRPARMLLALRDQLYVGACVYFCLQVFCTSAGITLAAGLGEPGWLLALSFLLILMLTVPVLSDLQITRLIQHLKQGPGRA